MFDLHCWANSGTFGVSSKGPDIRAASRVRPTSADSSSRRFATLHFLIFPFLRKHIRDCVKCILAIRSKKFPLISRYIKDYLTIFSLCMINVFLGENITRISLNILIQCTSYTRLMLLNNIFIQCTHIFIFKFTSYTFNAHYKCNRNTVKIYFMHDKILFADIRLHILILIIRVLGQS